MILGLDSILSEFRSFFGRIKDIIICFRDLLTFTRLLGPPRLLGNLTVEEGVQLVWCRCARIGQ